MGGLGWYGMVWYGMVWYGMVWYGMVWYALTHASPHYTPLCRVRWRWPASKYHRACRSARGRANEQSFHCLINKVDANRSRVSDLRAPLTFTTRVSCGVARLTGRPSVGVAPACDTVVPVRLNVWRDIIWRQHSVVVSARLAGRGGLACLPQLRGGARVSGRRHTGLAVRPRRRAAGWGGGRAGSRGPRAGRPGRPGGPRRGCRLPPFLPPRRAPAWRPPVGSSGASGHSATSLRSTTAR